MAFNADQIALFRAMMTSKELTRNMQYDGHRLIAVCPCLGLPDLPDHNVCTGRPRKI